MAVPNQDPINVSTANGVTSVFPYDFLILAAADLYVEDGGVARTLNVHYTVDGVGVQGGGNVTFLPGYIPADGNRVVRKRLMDYERTDQFQIGGELRATEVNKNYDAAVMMIQQLASGLGRALAYPDSVDPDGFDPILPPYVAGAPLFYSETDPYRVETGSEIGSGDLLLRGDLASSLTAKGTDLVSFPDAVAPAFLKTTSDIINGERVSVIRNIARTKHASLRAGTLMDDLAAPINELIAAMSTAGYGELYLPVGRYRHSGIDLVGGVSMVGEGWEAYTAYGTTATLGRATVLQMTATGRPAVRVQKRAGAGNRTSGASLRRLAMVWSHATPTGGWAPTVYDWGVQVDRADDVTLEDLLLVNPYKGVQITGTPTEPAGRLNMARVFGQPLLMGTEIDFSVDVTSLDRVHFWPFWSDNANVLAWMKANNATFLKSNRSDNTELNNLFGFGYARGIHVASNAYGTTQRLRGQGIDFDDGKRALWIDSTADGSSGSFTNFNATANPATTGADMLVGEADATDWFFANLRLSNSQSSSIMVSGVNGQYRFANLWCDQWNIALGGNAAISCGSGCVVDVTGGKFTQGNGAQVHSGGGTIYSDEWVSYTPTVSTQTGTLTSASATGKYRRRGKRVDIQIEASTTTNGTGATAVIASLPVQASAFPSVLAGRERNVTGKGVMGQILANASQVVMTLSADNGYPGGNSTIIDLTGSYDSV